MDAFVSSQQFLIVQCQIKIQQFHHCLDACGGYDGSSFLRSVEVYDANLDTWKQVAPMNVKRSRVALTANMGKLYGNFLQL